jgi:hypothetical protein
MVSVIVYQDGKQIPVQVDPSTLPESIRALYEPFEGKTVTWNMERNSVEEVKYDPHQNQ